MYLRAFAAYLVSPCAKLRCSGRFVHTLIDSMLERDDNYHHFSLLTSHEFCSTATAFNPATHGRALVSSQRYLPSRIATVGRPPRRLPVPLIVYDVPYPELWGIEQVASAIIFASIWIFYCWKRGFTPSVSLSGLLNFGRD